MATLKPNLTQKMSLQVDTLGGPGPIAFDEGQLTSNDIKRNEITDYIRIRLGDQMIDVELDPEHYKVAIDRALLRYRQRAQLADEESYAFLDLLPETQEYILPKEVQVVRQIFRRGIGSVTGTTASQFEPFASGYLNTYMLVAGRVGGLTNYEMFAQYQKLAMRMFGGNMNFTWNQATRKLTIIRKVPNEGHVYKRLAGLSSSGTAPGDIITITLPETWDRVAAGSQIVIVNCTALGYNDSYEILSVNGDNTVITVAAKAPLGSTNITGYDLSRTQVYCPQADDPAETVLLWLYNKRPDSQLFNDDRIYPWIQDYALALCKEMLGQAREKFATIAGPQGGTQLNGTALKQESKAEMEALEEELKRFIDGSQPYTWIIG